MNLRPRLVTVASLGLLMVGLTAACSSSGSTPKTSPPTFNEATAKQQITTNWQTFFDASKPVSAKAALVQDAAALQPVIAAQATNPQAQGTTAKVTKVVIDAGRTTAAVTYDILINGTAQLKNSVGTAVLENGVWKVSKKSFCALIALGAQAIGTTPPPVCAS